MDIFHFTIDKDFKLTFEMSLKWGAVLVGILTGLYFLRRKHLGLLNFEIDQAEIGIGDSKITLKPNFEDRQIAYKIYVELSTRKIGLLIDEKYDFIIEVYKSWYEFFTITRGLIKEIPVQKASNLFVINETDETTLSEVAIAVLNLAMRPHLTQWQARFISWYDCAKEKNKNISPQDLQREFPDYQHLFEDLVKVNHQLIRYKEIIRQIAFNTKSK